MADANAETLTMNDWGGGVHPYRIGHRKLGMWLVLADRLSGHGMPCPYWRKGDGVDEERGRGCAKHLQ